MQTALKKRLLDAAAAPYSSDRIRDYYWARGKLSKDPIFAALIEQNVFPDRARIIDLGCGRGLLAAWLLAAEKLAAENIGGAIFSPPKGLQIRGIDLLTGQALRGNTALQAVHGERVSLVSGDIRIVEIAEADAITMLDVLHYIPHSEQELLLDRIRAALGQNGLFVTRVGDATAGWRFRFSQYVDRCIASIQRRRFVSTWCRPLCEWRDVLEAKGFNVQVLPMSEGTLFANAMLICRVI